MDNCYFYNHLLSYFPLPAGDCLVCLSEPFSPKAKSRTTGKPISEESSDALFQKEIVSSIFLINLSSLDTWFSHFLSSLFLWLTWFLQPSPSSSYPPSLTLLLSLPFLHLLLLPIPFLWSLILCVHGMMSSTSIQPGYRMHLAAQKERRHTACMLNGAKGTSQDNLSNWLH